MSDNCPHSWQKFGNFSSGTIFRMSSTLSSFAAFPAGRPRRLRRDAFTRNLVRENALTTHDLIYPVFVQEGSGRRDAVASAWRPASR